MTDAIRPLIAGNWKMNGMKASAAEFEAMLAGAAKLAGKADLLVCPPATLIAAFAEKARGTTTLSIGAQDCHPKASGAHTGDLSAEMPADAGAGAIIVGHSERRADHGESDAVVRQKAEAAWRAGLVAIVCIGETRANAMPGKRLISAAASWRDRFRIRRHPAIWWWPMSRSGRSGPVSRQLLQMSSRFIALSEKSSMNALMGRGQKFASFMADP